MSTFNLNLVTLVLDLEFTEPETEMNYGDDGCIECECG